MIQRKPIWTEGLFVTQHHLQQQDLYHEVLVQERVRSLVPYCWGVSELLVDERALSAGQFRMTRLVAVLPDGTPVSFSEEDAGAPPPRPIADVFGAHLASLPVYVGLPHVRQGNPTVHVDGATAAPIRYCGVPSQVMDVNTGTGAQDTSWAQPNLRLLLGDESRENFDTIQVAELVRAAAGAIVLRDTFVPPTLRIDAAPFLVSGLHRVLTAMTTRQRSLAASRSQRSASRIEFQAGDVAKYWLLNILNESIPVVSHFVEHGNCHPETTYVELCRLVGKLCSFATDADPSEIPKFNYLALGDVFEPLFARAVSLINTVIAEQFTEIPLQRRDDGMHLGKIEDAGLLRKAFFLAVGGTLSEVELRDKLPKLTKIASWGQIGPLLNSAINGLRLELEYRPPGALPVRPGLVYFKLQKTPEYWQDVQGTGTIALYHPLPKDAVSLSLYVIDPSSI